MISQMNKVKTTIRKFKVENFKEICAFSKNICVSKSQIKSGYGTQTIDLSLPVSSNLKKLFGLGEKIFWHSEDGDFYELTIDGANLIKRVEGDIYGVYEIEKNGQKTALVLCNNPFTLDGENVENLPPVEHAILHKGRLYFADKSTVYVGRQFDFELRTQPLEICCTMGVNVGAGDIVGFFAKRQIVYVVCQKAIYSIKPSENTEDFNFERLSITGLNVKKGTLATFGGELAFITSNKLALFNGSSVNKINALLDGLSATFYNASTDAENYFLPLKNNNGSEFIYRYNILNGGEEFINTQCLQITDGGFTVKDNQIVKLDSQENNTEEKCFLTKQIDFGDCDRKTLCGIDINVNSNCTLTVNGVFGAKKYTLKKGRNALCVNLISDAFTLEINSIAQDFSAQSLTLFYRLKGE